jgi:predicted DNA-binding protein (MmcQ/YjbR family)
VAGTSPEETRAKLLALAFQFPEAWEDHPWGETVAKVGKKVFLFGGVDENAVHRISVKLDESHEQALGLEGATPTGYGLGKAGWVTIPLTSAPAGVLADFVEESYRRIAPKRLVSKLDAPG